MSKKTPLDIFKEQKLAVLKEYGAKYEEIDQKVSEKKKELAELEDNLKKAKSEFDSVTTDIKTSKAKLNTILSDAQAQSAKIIDDANRGAIEIYAEAEKCREDDKALREKASEMSRQAKISITSALDKEKKIDTLLSAADSNNEASRKALAIANQKKAENISKSEELEDLINKNKEWRKSLNMRQSILDEKINRLALRLNALDESENSLQRDRLELDALVIAKNKEFEDTKAKLASKEVNIESMAKALDKRQIDIDLQYEHVKNMKEDVERKTKRLEFLQKGSQK